jgi:biopolymer transport protein ExbB/TolQ
MENSMESQALGEVSSEGSFSMMELLMGADPIVQAVLVALVIASIWSWAVVAEKFFAVGGAKKLKSLKRLSGMGALMNMSHAPAKQPTMRAHVYLRQFPANGAMQRLLGPVTMPL